MAAVLAVEGDSGTEMLTEDVPAAPANGLRWWEWGDRLGPGLGLLWLLVKRVPGRVSPEPRVDLAELRHGSLEVTEETPATVPLAGLEAPELGLELGHPGCEIVPTTLSFLAGHLRFTIEPPDPVTWGIFPSHFWARMYSTRVGVMDSPILLFA